MSQDNAQIERELSGRLAELAGANLRLDLTRGKPAAVQLDLSNELDGILGGDYRLSDGTDARNYGGLRGIPEVRALGEELLGIPAANVIAFGNSSLELMHLVLDTAVNRGLLAEPLRDRGRIKAVCPVPGYDRHFTLTDSLGIEMTSVPIRGDGPDMDAIEALVDEDPTVSVLWCVPKYSNPTGCIYSPEVVERIALLPARAKRPFLVMWDNAYAVHDFEFPRAPLTSIFDRAKEHGTVDRIALFGSTSKITFAGAGVAFLGGSSALLDAIEAQLSVKTIGPDKVNQLRHARLLAGRLEEHMAAHAALVRPKFEAVEKGLEAALGNSGLATWTHPRGGYFISLDTVPGIASTVVEMARSVGVVLTPAGATFPYGSDPDDRNIRIAPTFATVSEVEAAIEVLGLCIRLAAASNRVNRNE